MFAAHFRDPRTLMRHRRTRRDLTEVAPHFFAGLGSGDIAGQHQHRIRRRVVRLEPLAHVFERSRIQIFHRSDDGVRVRMPDRISGLDDQILNDRIGLILALPLLVLHHAALQVEHFLADRVIEIAHPVGLGKQRVIERRSRNVLEIICAVFAGGAVQSVAPMRSIASM